MLRFESLYNVWCYIRKCKQVPISRNTQAVKHNQKYTTGFPNTDISTMPTCISRYINKYMRKVSALFRRVSRTCAICWAAIRLISCSLAAASLAYSRRRVSSCLACFSASARSCSLVNCLRCSPSSAMSSSRLGEGSGLVASSACMRRCTRKPHKAHARKRQPESMQMHKDQERMGLCCMQRRNT